MGRVGAGSQWSSLKRGGREYGAAATVGHERGVLRGELACLTMIASDQRHAIEDGNGKGSKESKLHFFSLVRHDLWFLVGL